MHYRLIAYHITRCQLESLHATVWELSCLCASTSDTLFFYFHISTEFKHYASLDFKFNKATCSTSVNIIFAPVIFSLRHFGHLFRNSVKT